MLKRLLGCYGLVLILPFASLAQQTYPWVKIDARDMRIFDSAAVEAQFRLELVKNAKKSIDIITYDQRADETVSLPLLHELRAAAERGVKVRFLRGSYLSKIFTQYFSESNHSDPVKNILTQPPARTPVEYIEMGNPTMFFGGWAPTTGAHEKLIVIDRYYVIIGGRGLAATYLTWEDNCHILKGEEISNHATQVFENLWNTIKSENVSPPLNPDLSLPNHEPDNFFLPTIPSKTDEIEFENSDSDSDSDSNSDLGSGPDHDSPTQTQLSSASSPRPALKLTFIEKKKLHSLIQWSKAPEHRPLFSSQNKFHTYDRKVRIIHHDLIAQIKQHCGVYWFYGYHSCIQKIEDPIIQRIIQLIQYAQDVQLYTLSVQLHPALKKVLLARLREKKKFDLGDPTARDFHLTLFTNGLQSHQEVIPYPIGWYSGLQDLYRLMQLGAQAYAFEKSPDENSKVYLHRKGILITLFSGTKYYISGSHNLSEASSVTNDELVLEIKSNEVVNHETSRLQRSLTKYGVELNQQEIAAQQRENRLPWPIGWVWKFVLHASRSFF